MSGSAGNGSDNGSAGDEDANNSEMMMVMMRWRRLNFVGDTESFSSNRQSTGKGNGSYESNSY